MASLEFLMAAAIAGQDSGPAPVTTVLPTTGVATLVGDTGSTGVNSLVSGGTDSLYAVRLGASNGFSLALNDATGAVTALPRTPVSFTDVFRHNDNFYGISASTFIPYTPTTGADGSSLGRAVGGKGFVQGDTYWTNFSNRFLFPHTISDTGFTFNNAGRVVTNLVSDIATEHGGNIYTIVSNVLYQFSFTGPTRTRIGTATNFGITGLIAIDIVSHKGKLHLLGQPTGSHIGLYTLA